MGKPEKIFNVLFISLAVIAILGVLTLAWSLISTMISTKSHELELCFTSECLNNAKKIYSPQIELLFGIVSFVGTIATVGGIIVAVHTYMNNVSTNALSNHIAHLQVFQDYLVIELSKHDHLNISSVDVYGWYNSIFTESIQGRVHVSDSYKCSVESINNVILQSNIEAQTAENGSFRYKQHQTRMTSILNDFGINMGYHPRNDYFEIEGQVLKLISSINKAFCSNSEVINFEQRQYI
ncbi:retron Ec48 family effector membrane protein [Vibrio parahaemolyticus]|uniref:retron Ec48 family effector membrane protein n=1 Tax=Vibrio parahaemolyticus TaxID=670 RepID=UPI001E4F9221|nr:retron Ec48 family effector membrane protein [Vibrio parahaemolyticus]